LIILRAASYVREEKTPLHMHYLTLTLSLGLAIGRTLPKCGRHLHETSLGRHSNQDHESCYSVFQLLVRRSTEAMRECSMEIQRFAGRLMRELKLTVVIILAIVLQQFAEIGSGLLQLWSANNRIMV
jgi:hypothetical protein